MISTCDDRATFCALSVVRQGLCLEALDLSENTKLSPVLGPFLGLLAKHPTLQGLDIHGILLDQIHALGNCLAENRSLHTSLSATHPTEQPTSKPLITLIVISCTYYSVVLTPSTIHTLVLQAEAISAFVALAPIVETNQVLQDMQMEGLQSYIDAEAVAVGLPLLRIEKALVFNRWQHANANALVMPEPPTPTGPVDEEVLDKAQAEHDTTPALSIDQQQQPPQNDVGDTSSSPAPVTTSPHVVIIEEEVPPEHDGLTPKVKQIAARINARITQKMMEGYLTTKESQLGKRQNQVRKYRYCCPYACNSTPKDMSIEYRFLSYQEAQPQVEESHPQDLVASDVVATEVEEKEAHPEEQQPSPLQPVDEQPPDNAASLSLMYQQENNDRAVESPRIEEPLPAKSPSPAPASNSPKGSNQKRQGTTTPTSGYHRKDPYDKDNTYARALIRVTDECLMKPSPCADHTHSPDGRITPQGHSPSAEGQVKGKSPTNKTLKRRGSHIPPPTPVR